MEITGKIKQIGETQTFGANGFRKREFVIITEDKYPQHIPLECVQDKVDLLNNLKVGQVVTAAVNVQGREWTNPQGEVKHFLSLQAWSINIADGGSVPSPFEKTDSTNDGSTDDLPF